MERVYCKDCFYMDERKVCRFNPVVPNTKLNIQNEHIEWCGQGVKKEVTFRSALLGVEGDDVGEKIKKIIEALETSKETIIEPKVEEPIKDVKKFVEKKRGK